MSIVTKTDKQSYKTKQNKTKNVTAKFFWSLVTVMPTIDHKVSPQSNKKQQQPQHPPFGKDCSSMGDQMDGSVFCHGYFIKP